jgi:hypothetical protein
MTKNEADELLALAARVREAFWHMECSCPQRWEAGPVHNGLDVLISAIQEMTDGRIRSEHDV